MQQYIQALFPFHRRKLNIIKEIQLVTCILRVSKYKLFKQLNDILLKFIQIYVDTYILNDR